MLDSDSVRSVAQEWLDAHRPGALIFGVDEFPWGWAVQYESLKFFETQDISFLMDDRSPIYVMRDGTLMEPIADASVAPDEQIEQFDAQQQG